MSYVLIRNYQKLCPIENNRQNTNLQRVIYHYQNIFLCSSLIHNIESKDNCNIEFEELVVISTISEHIDKYIKKIPCKILSLIGK